MAAMRRFTCYDCNETFEVPYGTGVQGRAMKCPRCNGQNVHRAEGDRGFERGPGRGALDAGGAGTGRGRGGARRGPGGAR
jgi:transposase-like protein